MLFRRRREAVVGVCSRGESSAQISVGRRRSLFTVFDWFWSWRCRRIIS